MPRISNHLAERNVAPKSAPIVVGSSTVLMSSSAGSVCWFVDLGFFPFPLVGDCLFAVVGRA